MNNFVTPAPHNSVRKSVIRGALDHIQHKPRSMNSYDPTEDFLNERSTISFDDTARSIRAHTAALLKQVHAPVPKSIKPLVLSSLYNNYTERPISERIASDEYITHLLRPLPGKRSNGIDVSYYPETGHTHLGKTHLACLTYAGDHTIPRRRHLMVSGDNDFRNVRSDIELLSRYTRMRQGANADYRKGDNATGQQKNHTEEPVVTNGSAYEQPAPKEDEQPIPNGHVDEEELPVEPIIKAERKSSSSSAAGVRKLSKDVTTSSEDAEEQNKRPLLKKIKKSSTKDVSFDEAAIMEQENQKKQKLLLEAEKKELEEQEAELKRLEEEQKKLDELELEVEKKRQAAAAVEEAERKQRELEERLAEEYRKEQERRLEEERRLQEKLAEERILAEQKELEEKLRKVKEEQELQELVTEDSVDVEDDVFESEPNAEQMAAAIALKRKSVNDEFDWGEIENDHQPTGTAASAKDTNDYEASDDDEPAVAEETIRLSSTTKHSKLEVTYSEEETTRTGSIGGVRDSTKSPLSHTEPTEKSKRTGSSAAQDSDRVRSTTEGAADDKTDNTEELSENEAEPIVDEPVTPETEAQKKFVEIGEVSSDEEEESE